MSDTPDTAPTVSNNIVEFPNDSPQVEMLNELLQLAKAGQIESIAVLVQQRGEEPFTITVVTDEQRLPMIGLCEVLKDSLINPSYE